MPSISVRIRSNNSGNTIPIIDTPGHEAFTEALVVPTLPTLSFLQCS